MRAWLRRTAGVVSAGTVAAALAVGVASRRWHEATERETHQMTRRAARPVGAVSFEALESLPAPVARYFRTVLLDGQPRIRSARLAQTGRFRSRESADPASRLAAVHRDPGLYGGASGLRLGRADPHGPARERASS